MGIDNIFSDNNTFPMLGIQIGGTPLAEILSEMFQIIRKQQNEIDSLRRSTEDKISRSEINIKQHEESIKNISEDLKLHMRPFSCEGQSGMLTMANTVSTIALRLARVEEREKCFNIIRLEEYAKKKLITLYYNQWVLYRRIQVTVKLLLLNSKKNIWQRYMRIWNRYLTIRSKQKAQRRHLMGLLITHERRIVLKYWFKWFQFINLKERSRVQRRMSAHESADVMLRLTSRGLARRCFYLWQQFIKDLNHNKTKVRVALLLEQKTARYIAEIYLQKWITAHRWRRILMMRWRALDVMQRNIYRDFTHHYLNIWISFTIQQRRNRKVKRFIPHLHHVNLSILARRYFSRLFNYRLLCRDIRARESLELRLRILTDRADKLQQQLDVGLHTLSHTNSVLARVVDTVMIAEEPRSALQHLLQEEIMMSTVPMKDINMMGNGVKYESSLRETPHRVRGVGSGIKQELETSREEQKEEEEGGGKMRASDMLQKLRTRLDKTYKAAATTSQKNI